MNINLSGLKIYNSSAGSGKTYSLIKEYLLILFYSENIYMFKHILVITFTNKVVNEIKFNILNKLNELSKGIESDLFLFITNKLNKSSDEIKLKAKNILKIIIHNYRFFNISTIDKFYYKIINHLNIKINLHEEINIELNTNYILKKSVKILLNNLNNSDFYSKILIDFSLNKMKEGNTWNPYNYLIKLSNFLIKEENISFLEKLKNYSINDFIILDNILNNKIINIHNELNNKSILFFKELKKRNILIKSFYRLLLPFFFKKISKKIIFSDISNILNKKLDEIILNKKIYSKNIDFTQKKIIDNFFKTIKYLYIKSKKYLYQYFFYSYIKKNILSIITLFKLKKILYKVKKEDNIFFNIDIYKIINNKINENYILDIYENIGERYYHYFIDEFQDTSILQWMNINPLIDNALSETGTVLIAGDVKQSIYRWRGADIEQFLKLINSNYKKKIQFSLINYRSYKEIVKFNNLLYSSINKKFNNQEYENIYKINIKQKIFKEHDGYVELNFLKSKKNYNNIVYNKIKNKIFLLLEQGYRAMEIAILVRKNKEAFILSELFNTDGISVLNSNYMLLKNFWQIKCIIKLFRIISSPYNIKLRIYWVIYLKKINKIKCDDKIFHNLLLEISLLSIDLFFKKLSLYGIDLKVNIYLISSIIHLTQEIIKSIKLNDKTSLVITQFFLDFILNNIEETGNSIYIFLKIWDLKKDKEFILLSEDIDAIKIMTIHKSKGLEFPVVFIPFLYWRIFKEKEFYIYQNIYPNIFNKKDSFYLKNHILYNIINLIQEKYNKNIDQIYIDNFNLLYVATTRAIEQLILFTINTENSNIIGYYLKNMLVKENYYLDNKNIYTFGMSKKYDNIYKKNIENNNFSIYYNKYYSDILYFKNINNIKKYNKLSDDDQYKSLTMIHHIYDINIILNKIYYKFYNNNYNNFKKIKENILSIVNHINLNIFYTNKYKILLQNEVFFQNEIIKINRLIFFYKKIIIINYMTNGSYKMHIINIKNSIKALSNMGYKNIEALLISVKDKIKIINI